jgi:metal-responsive CopG/Arc/MetJ family transcriptional regulator
MRITVTLNDDLVRIAKEYTGVTDQSALIREALKALIERESARRLGSLGGTMPGLKNSSRRRVSRGQKPRLSSANLRRG